MTENRAYEDLANAIIVQAINDYANADKREDITDPQQTRNEIIAFFRGKWITCLTTVDPEYLLRVAEQKRREANRS